MEACLILRIKCFPLSFTLGIMRLWLSQARRSTTSTRVEFNMGRGYTFNEMHTIFPQTPRGRRDRLETMAISCFSVSRPESPLVVLGRYPVLVSLSNRAGGYKDQAVIVACLALGQLRDRGVTLILTSTHKGTWKRRRWPSAGSAVKQRHRLTGQIWAFNLTGLTCPSNDIPILP